jgi:Uma2 family endonuclease
MAEPARKPPIHDETKPARRAPDEEFSGIDVVQRWVEGPDGRMQLLELPLTPELFLDPQDEDKIIQHPVHHFIVGLLFDWIRRRLASEPDVMVLSDAKHLLGPGLPGPGPDISVVRGIKERDFASFDLAEQGVVPCLIVEVVSPSSPRIRKTDEVDKVALYEQVGIPEYIMVSLRRVGRNSFRFGLRGLRLGPDQRYRPMVPDDQGRLLSETTGLLFAVSPGGDGIYLVNAQTGERLLTSDEEEAGRKLAEQEARVEKERRRLAEQEARAEKERRRLAEQEARAEKERRNALEAEIERLRAEIERRGSSGASDAVKK